MLKTRQQAPNGVTYAKSPVNKPKLTVSASPRSGVFNQSTRNHLISTS